jgi:hypothetical protein
MKYFTILKSWILFLTWTANIKGLLEVLRLFSVLRPCSLFCEGRQKLMAPSCLRFCPAAQSKFWTSDRFLLNLVWNIQHWGQPHICTFQFPTIIRPTSWLSELLNGNTTWYRVLKYFIVIDVDTECTTSIKALFGKC